MSLEFVVDLFVSPDGVHLTRVPGEVRFSEEQVKIFARLRINLVSKKVLSERAEWGGFWPYISVDASIAISHGTV